MNSTDDRNTFLNSKGLNRSVSSLGSNYEIVPNKMKQRNRISSHHVEQVPLSAGINFMKKGNSDGLQFSSHIPLEDHSQKSDKLPDQTNNLKEEEAVSPLPVFVDVKAQVLSVKNTVH